jgi:hypothetical protein
MLLVIVAERDLCLTQSRKGEQRRKVIEAFDIGKEILHDDEIFSLVKIAATCGSDVCSSRNWLGRTKCFCTAGE